MQEYQVLARKYRPKRFCEVIGQEAIVTTLKNSIAKHRLAHAYLFSGSHGTGKTTLARIFAKALNCKNPGQDLEPCGVCPSCKEIGSGSSMDVLEVDGASHRGIDDIRTINETVSYSAPSGKYKIYIIDEVHMLTKEAFNALLKTLEEPPEKVKFFFATTEAHKVPPTILSRCQHYTLNRIGSRQIIDKLSEISKELSVEVDPEALELIARRAGGGLRDAESLFDQLLCCHEGKISTESTAKLLGVMPQEVFFAIDQAGSAGNFMMAFTVVEQIWAEGKNLVHFVEMLTEHYRSLLLFQLGGDHGSVYGPKEALEASSKLYTKEQLLFLLEYLVQMQQEIRFAPSPKVMLEAILLKVLQSGQRIEVKDLLKRLAALEKKEPMEPPAPLPKPPAPQKIQEMPKPKPTPPQNPPVEPPKELDTVMQFAAVELEGTVQKR